MPKDKRETGMFQDIWLYQSKTFHIADATTHLGSISYDFNKSSKLVAILTQCRVGQYGAKTPNPVLNVTSDAIITHRNILRWCYTPTS